MPEESLLHKAVRIACEAHAGQSDKELTMGADIAEAVEVAEGPSLEACELTCNVCHGESGKAIGVACSSLGAISFAYCRPCLEHHAEPFNVLRNIVLWDAKGLENCADWVHHLQTWHEGLYITVHELPPLTEAECADLQRVDDEFAWEQGELHDFEEA